MYTKNANRRRRRRALAPIGGRIRQFREQKELSQGDIERKTGLLRCYISRVENGHTVPSLDTLERLAGAVEVPLYRFFYDGKEPPTPLLTRGGRFEYPPDASGKMGPEAQYIRKLGESWRRMADSDRKVWLAMAKKLMVRHEDAVDRRGVTDLSVNEARMSPRHDHDHALAAEPMSTQQSNRMEGTIGKVIHEQGFGFIRTEKGWEVIFHETSVEQLNFRTLKEGQTVEFELQPTNGGTYPRAAVVRARPA